MTRTSTLLIPATLAVSALFIFLIHTSEDRPEARPRPIAVPALASTAALPEASNLPPASPSPADPRAQIEDEISGLREQAAQIDHELSRLGFPSIFLDERLDDPTRRLLLDKIQRATNLQNRITALKLQKLAMSATEDL